MARKCWGAAIALVLLVATAACGRAPEAGRGGAGANQPPAWVEPACTASASSPLETTAAPRGGIPDDFVPSGVLRCRTEAREMVGQGTFSMLITERADTGTAELLAELRRPSDPLSNGVCDASYVAPPYFILVDAEGKALLPAVPTDGCGKPRLEVRNLVEALPYRTVSEVRQGQLESPLADKTGCSDSWKDTIAIDAGHARPAPAHPLWPEQTSEFKVCVYDRISDDNIPVGQLSAGYPIAGEAATTLRANLDSAGPAANCSAEHTRFAVLRVAGQGNWATVELDGCLRVQRPDNSLGQLDQAVLSLIAQR
jgi:hypothetical protein